ncbi:hypothetical protein [Cellulomonas sp. ATA003]|uniref:hypothetical protein n=1 Tax=Cellulomonas sp. ATA003 TaxID=3073064 RepID=UPI0028738AB0|nr:hypothetical protein [Cellulomonas sp. ATA003]WNB84851.1 hypothetical protein REH70_14040 [Cellulomonas sp. ATA003]
MYVVTASEVADARALPGAVDDAGAVAVPGAVGAPAAVAVAPDGVSPPSVPDGARPGAAG